MRSGGWGAARATSGMLVKILEALNLEGFGVKLVPLLDWRNVSLDWDSRCSSRPTGLGLIMTVSTCAEPA